MKVAIYCRVSTTEQSADNQLLALEKWAKDRGWEVIAVYREEESAWRAGHQRKLARLINDIQMAAIKIEAVLVWALDRLTREGIAKQFALLNTFTTYNVKVLSYRESWTEFPNEMTPLFHAIVAYFAEAESRRLSERTKAGMERARAQGKQIGRPKGSKDKKKRDRRGYFLRHASPAMREKYGK